MAFKPQVDLSRIARNRPFLLLWGAQILSQLAFNVLNFILLIRVFTLSSSSLAVSLLILSIGVPSLIFGLLAGVYVDRWNKKAVLVATNLLRAGAVLLYLPFLTDGLAWLYLITFGVASITQFFAPAEAATIPALVRGGARYTANSLFLFTLYGAFIIGYSIAGPIQHLLGETAPYYLAAGAYAIAAFLSFLLPARRHRRLIPLPLAIAERGISHELREGIRAIRSDHRISRPILFLTLSQALIGVIIVLVPAFAEEILRISVRDASYILIAPAGVGMILGAIAMSRLRKVHDRLRLLGGGVLLSGLALIGLSLSRGVDRLLEAQALEPHSALIRQGFLSLDRIVNLLSLTGLMLFLLGLAASVVTIAAQTLLQERTSEKLRGRVFGALNMLVNLAATLPILAAGILADISSVVVVIFGLGALATFWGVFELWRSRKRRRKRFSLGKPKRN